MPLFELVEDGISYDEVEFFTVKSALQYAVANVVQEPTQNTYWVEVLVRDLSNPEHDELRETVPVYPTEPDCTESDHCWEAPYSVVGGLKENPGVFGHGGGVTISEVCSFCGTYREQDTWAQNPYTGEQGLDSVCYRDPDERSLQWIRSI